MVDPMKIALILNLEALRGVKQLRATLGNTGYYRKFIKGYAQITVPMEKLLKKDVTFCWNEDCQKRLDVLKGKMVTVLLWGKMHGVWRMKTTLKGLPETFDRL